MVYKRLERILIQLDSVDSTNSYASQMLRSTKPKSGTIIRALDQHSGRGQRSTTWTSEPGKNLTFSVILLPELKTRHAFYLNIVAGLAVRKTLEDIGIQSSIKWPNDILIGRKKVAGILVENQISGENVRSSVIGFGINVNQEDFEALSTATSLKNELLGKDVDLNDLLNQLYGYLDFYYNLLLESNFELLKKHYYKHLYLKDELAPFRDADGEFEGRITGIDENGLLQIKVGDKIRRYDIKEVHYSY
ncbi:MAG: biotin--[acetyl-CoA-carboxylase] ligase [Crocinitomicaceae bacterium]|nr:biotin--[acetyl-CoA-carboxylase] ligase [Crocinitomicaceae bacterium]